MIYIVSYGGLGVSVEADDEDEARRLGLKKIRAEIATITERDLDVDEDE